MIVLTEAELRRRIFDATAEQHRVISDLRRQLRAERHRRELWEARARAGRFQRADVRAAHA